MAFLIPLQRAQEWNISKKELNSLVEIGVLTKEEVKDSISITFNPVGATQFDCKCWRKPYVEQGWDVMMVEIDVKMEVAGLMTIAFKPESVVSSVRYNLAKIIGRT